MIIESVIFFAWVFLVVLVGAVVALTKRRSVRREAAVDNIEPTLSFPQRHWLLIAIVVAIVSPLMVQGLHAAVHSKRYNESVERAAMQPSQDSTAKDTTYRVAVPPQH